MITLTTWDEHNSSRKVTVSARDVISVEERTDRRAYSGNNETALVRLRDGSTFKVVDYGRKTAENVERAKENELHAEHVALHHPACERKDGCCQ